MQTCFKAIKTGKGFFASLTAGATLALVALVSASSSHQVEQLDSLAVPRTGHAATALSDGRVLITGGRDSAGNRISLSEIFVSYGNSKLGLLARMLTTASLPSHRAPRSWPMAVYLWPVALATALCCCRGGFRSCKP